jgi:hypothetical protein
MTLELDNYGFMLDTEWCYVALSWQLLITATLLTIGYKVYKIMTNKKDKSITEPFIHREDNSFWGTDE